MVSEFFNYLDISIHDNSLHSRHLNWLWQSKFWMISVPKFWIIFLLSIRFSFLMECSVLDCIPNSECYPNFLFSAWVIFFVLNSLQTAEYSDGMLKLIHIPNYQESKLSTSSLQVLYVQSPNCQSSKINEVLFDFSERANATGATGQRLKEGAHINKSLVTLG